MGGRDHKKLGMIQNNDIGNMIASGPALAMSPSCYRSMVDHPLTE